MVDSLRNEKHSDWPEVRALFEACLDLDDGARARHLAAATPTVRAECMALLAEHKSDHAHLDPEAAHRRFVDSAVALVCAGSRIGEFRVLAPLGRGGMGMVVLAEQATPHRRVAIKLLSTALPSGSAAARFHHEAELLGRLHHAGIAQVYAVGVHEQDTPLGRICWPFFAMEYVEGARTLAAWAAEAPRTQAERLEAMLEICAAVQHAHERGVVHRDLKPQNVLVGADGAIKVIDFGIARTLVHDADGRHALTNAGELLGTLRYMSPEQVRGDRDRIDTRTDVHALGVVLFELLTGRLPFDLEHKSLVEAGRILTEVDAMPLRRVMPVADPDLELILATAMAKDPGRRYATAGSLAEDLQRFRRREPINARATTFGYQLRMFARRRRGLVGAVVALLLTAGIGTATSLVYAYQARQAQQQAERQGDVTADAMQRVFDQAMRNALDVPRRLEGLPGATGLRRDQITQAMQQLEFVERTVALDLGMRLVMARAYFELGAVQGAGYAGHVGDRAAARASFDLARNHLDHVISAHPDDAEVSYVLVDLELACGGNRFDTNRDLDGAQRHLDAAAAGIEGLRRLPPVKGRDLRRVEAKLLAHTGLVAKMRGELAPAMQKLHRAVELHMELLAGSEPDVAACRDIAGLWHSIAQVEDVRGQLDEAGIAYERAIELLALSDRQPDHMALRQLLAMVRSEYGYLLVRRGETATGETELRWGQRELARLRARDPDDAGLQISFGAASQRLAEHLTVVAKYAGDDDARRHYTEARQFASDALDLVRPLRARSPDMMTVFLESECKRLLALCDANLR